MLPDDTPATITMAYMVFICEIIVEVVMWAAKGKHKVLWAIVASIAIHVVNNLLWFKVSAEHFLHNQTMFFNILSALNGSRMGRASQTDIAVNDNATSFPVGVVLCRLTSFGPTNKILLVEQPSTLVGTEVVLRVVNTRWLSYNILAAHCAMS